MTAEQFIKDANYIFSIENLYQIDAEIPEKKASQQLNRKFKAFLKSQFPDWTIGKFDGYCESSGFISKQGKFVYISISDLRYWKNWPEDVLIRTADSDKDYRGHNNHRSTIKSLKYDVLNLISE